MKWKISYKNSVLSPSCLNLLELMADTFSTHFCQKVTLGYQEPIS